MSEKLKPCPFCGQEVDGKPVRLGGRDRGYVECEECGVMRRDWNTRPTEDRLRRELAAANGLLDDCKLSMEDIIHHIENDETAMNWIVDCIERIAKRERSG